MQQFLKIGYENNYHFKSHNYDIESKFNKKYQGAANFNINDGIVYSYVLGVDFTSLYPSAILYHNLCLTRYRGCSANQPHPKDYYIIELDDKQYPEIKYIYLDKDVAGIVNVLVDEVLAQKNESDDKLKKMQKNTIEYNVENQLRTAYKLIINTVYGVSGGAAQPIFCLPIAMTVTSVGRTVFNHNINIIKKELSGTVILGDTDSAFFTFDNKHQTKQLVTKEIVEYDYVYIKKQYKYILKQECDDDIKPPEHKYQTVNKSLIAPDYNVKRSRSVQPRALKYTQPIEYCAAKYSPKDATTYLIK